MATVTASPNGHEEKSRRHPRWTRQETQSLIQAKDITEKGLHRGRMVGPASENMEPKWVSISSYCKQQGVNREPAQCRKRWSNLIADFKKIMAWESKLVTKPDSGADSFWIMRNDLRKERKLPVSFDREVFTVLERRETGSGFAAESPLPLHVVAAVSDDTDCCYGGDDDEEEEEGERVYTEPKETNDYGSCEDVEGAVLSDFKGEVQKENDKEKMTDNVTESPVKEFCSAELVSEQQQPACQNQNRGSSQGVFEESWPGISYWDSHKRGKRQRLSTDGDQVIDMNAQIIGVLETNNKMLNDQLDVHNKNCQLDREQRKENNDALVAALDKLTNALVKIAEKI